MTEITEEEILDEVECCMYCGDTWNRQKHYMGCCGEIHFEEYYVLKNGDCIPKDQCKIVEKELTEEQKFEKTQEDKYDFYKNEME